MRLLDSLEWAGFGAYERKEVVVELETGKKYSCWCYFVKYPKKEKVISIHKVRKIVK